MFASIDWLTFSRLSLVTLLHFTWQATLVIALVALFRSLFPPRRFHSRYAVCVAGMLLLLAAPFMTAGYYLAEEAALRSLNSNPVVKASAELPATMTIVEQTEAAFLEVFHWFDSNRDRWLCAWLLGFVVLLCRLGRGLNFCLRLRRNRQALPPQVCQLVDDLKQRFQISGKVIVASSTEIGQALATGVIKPIVLIPACWVTRLPSSALEAVIAHELAHVKRWDLWINYLQRLVETLFFFHPLVWWLSNRVTTEREACCDHLAVSVTGQPMEYVETLARVSRDTDFANFNFQFGTAFSGEKNMNLLRRAKLILEPNQVESPASFRSLSLILGVGLMAIYGSFAYCATTNPAALAAQDQDHRQHNHDHDHEHDHKHVHGQGNQADVERSAILELDQDPRRIELARGLHGHLVELIHDRHGRQANDEVERLHRHLRHLLHGQHDGPVDGKKLAEQLRRLADQLEHDSVERGQRRQSRDEDIDVEIHMSDEGRIEKRVRRAKKSHSRGKSSSEPSGNVEVEIRFREDGSVDKVHHPKHVARNSKKGELRIVEVEPETEGGRVKLAARIREPKQSKTRYKLRKSDVVDHQSNEQESLSDDIYRASEHRSRENDLNAAIHALREEVKQLRREMQEMRAGKSSSREKKLRWDWRDDGKTKEAKDKSPVDATEVTWLMNERAGGKVAEGAWVPNQADSKQELSAIYRWVEKNDGKDTPKDNHKGEVKKLKRFKLKPDDGQQHQLK